jgi:pSer/pThr/pTyr-binding forkhead associated (FHA) protein/ribosomal protein L40E
MIVCPNCNHQNPDAAVQCEACYTPLPAMMDCPNCGALVQADASFCGQCGFNLQTAETQSMEAQSSEKPLPAAFSPAPELVPNPVIVPEPLVPSSANGSESTPVAAQPIQTLEGEAAPLPNPIPEEAIAPAVSAAPAMSSNPTNSKTQLQTQIARLLHVQTNTPVELPGNLAVIHIGKPNDRVPPDVDVSGFPHSEIVSRIHADVRVEGDIYYIEDVGSSNGTYINNAPLPSGNRHRLRPGDRIALGKGDKVTFLFQIS